VAPGGRRRTAWERRLPQTHRNGRYGNMAS
jgi:hypothetical protein